MTSLFLCCGEFGSNYFILEAEQEQNLKQRQFSR